MVDAMLLWRRAPDRERGWLAVRAHWPEIKRHGWGEAVAVLGVKDGDHRAEDKPEPRRLPLTRDEVAEMELVGEWIGLIAEDDRRIVVLALMALARGKDSGKDKVPWTRLLKPMGMKTGAGRLSQRYRRAIAYLAFRLNGTEHAEAMRLVQRRGEGWQDVFPNTSG
jgi:hypothetical protein